MRHHGEPDRSFLLEALLSRTIRVSFWRPRS